MSTTALLIIDVQVAIISGAYREAEVLREIAGLANRARRAAVRVIYLQHCHDRYPPMMKGAEVWRIHPAIEPQRDDVVIEKAASDSFWNTGLAIELERRRVGRLVLCGLQTEFCV